MRFRPNNLDVEMNIIIDDVLVECRVDFHHDEGQKGSFHQEEIEPTVEIQDVQVYLEGGKVVSLAKFIDDGKEYDETMAELEQQAFQYLEDMHYEY